MSFLSIILLVIFFIVGSFFLWSLKRLIKGIINYHKLGKKEFMKRLKDGFESITPAQRSKGEINGIIISLIGNILGLVVTPIIRIDGVWYWVELILLGGLVITIFSLIGKWQLYLAQKKQEDIINKLTRGENGD